MVKSTGSGPVLPEAKGVEQEDDSMIQTTVVGSYPVPAWLRVYNTRESLRVAMLVVLKTQELAGIDVVADGELYRWDINHPETNGMIDYFGDSPGISTKISGNLL